MKMLRDYIAQNGVKQAALATMLGISRGHMSQIVNGAKVPSLDLAFAIERATSGAVPVSSWAPIVKALTEQGE